MNDERLTSAESHELASLVHTIGARNVLTILRNASAPKKNKRIYNFQKLPSDIKAKVAVMVSSGKYSQKDMLDYINLEIEKRKLDVKVKVSRTSLNRFLNNVVYGRLPS
ncbi:hypothetical protein [Shewanella khirikhana]|uniref:Uncharacterized protein n=1 Tax=Shewanella khirikhana TaxID=1965282 RepID=A0ABM7D178_9GAMM|nr:hypothetical protein [Shewanella khirikhana]AZQ10124.1 hypothetical protein STH12_00988 [Shewanella khirikhana]